MPLSMIILLTFIAIVVSIIAGIKFKINIGIPAFLFSIVIGVYLLGLSMKDIYDIWPIGLTIQIAIITFFYGFASTIGTIEYIAGWVMYIARNVPHLMPLFFSLLVFSLGVIGIPPIASSMFLIPIFIGYCKKTKSNELYVGIFAIIAGMSGMLAPTGFLGILVAGVLTELGIDPALYSNKIFYKSIIIASILIAVYYFGLKLFKRTKVQYHFEKPKAPTVQQRINLIIIFVLIISMFLPQVVQKYIPNTITGFLSRIDTMIFYLVGIVLCTLFHLAEEKEVIKNHIPWGILILLGGMTSLIGLLNKANFSQIIASTIEQSSLNISPVFIVVIFVLGAGILAAFSDGVSVVTPTLITIAVSLSQVAEIDLALILTCIPVAAICTGISPFSAGGAITLSFVDENRRDTIFKGQLMSVGVNIVVICTIVLIGII
ncbi:MAG: SLC13 family permease [Eubacteriaceae bacterium]